MIIKIISVVMLEAWWVMSTIMHTKWHLYYYMCDMIVLTSIGIHRDLKEDRQKAVASNGVSNKGPYCGWPQLSHQYIEDGKALGCTCGILLGRNGMWAQIQHGLMARPWGLALLSFCNVLVLQKLMNWDFHFWHFVFVFLGFVQWKR